MRTPLRRRGLRGTTASALLALSAFAPCLRAQGRPLNVSGVQALAFGPLFPGVPMTVSPSDALRAGQFQVTGSKNSAVRITFTLPAVMAVGGATVPLRFGPGDAGYSTQSSIGSATAFDPRAPLVANLSQQGRLYLFLGGTALPSGLTPGGDYTAAVTVDVCYVGVTC